MTKADIINNVSKETGFTKVEVELLLESGALQCETQAEGVVKCLLSWASLPDLAAALGERGRSALLSHQGASQETLNALQNAGFFKPHHPLHG